MEIHIGNRVAEVELLSKEDNLVSLLIDGEEYSVDIAMLEEGVYSILHEGRSYNAELTHSDNRKTYKVNTGFTAFDIEIFDTQTKYLRLKKGGDEHKNDRIVAPMPGKVIRIPVQVGDRLAADETVLVIEAMKMQNNYKVSSDCIVKEILVQEGDSVNTNQLLAVLDLLETEKEN